MEHIAMISHGKDSLAMLEAIKILGLPLDRIITVDIWATPTLRGELPEMVKFKVKADKIIFQRYGIEVEHLKAGKSFEEQFYETIKRGKHAGDIYGYPQTVHAWCNDRLKMRPLASLDNIQCVRYLGIAADEYERIERQKGKEDVVLPLVLIGWDEKQCYRYCDANGLLSPSYTSSFRDGCWFCPKQPIEQLRLLRKNNRDLWDLMLKWDTDSPVPFKADGHTVHDFDKRFELEDKGLIPIDRTFRWKMIKDFEVEV